MATYDSFLPYVLPYTPGCTDMLAVQHIRDICIDFCSKTLILQQTVDPITVVAGQTEYEADAPAGTHIHVITHAWYKRTPLVVMNGDDPALHPELFNATFSGANVDAGDPSALLCSPKGVITLNRAPSESADNALTIRAALKPTRSSTKVDDLLFTEYAYEIGMGAATNLMLVPQQPFTDVTAAMNHRTIYLNARSSARIRANKAFGRSQARIQFRSF